MYDFLSIAPTLETAAELSEAGMAAEAAELRAGIVGVLNDAIAEQMAWAEGALATNPARASQHLLYCVTALRVYEPVIGELSMPLERCLETFAALCASLQQNEAVEISRLMARADYKAFYPISPSSQIIILDGLYQRLFGQKRTGQFVEIGAYDGDTFSNTSGLADLGWQGIYIEPMPGAFESCRRRHAGNAAVAVLNIAIGATTSTAFMTDQGPMTQVSGGAQAGAVKVEVRRLDDVLTEQNMTPGFDLLVVDVEGFEGEVFAGFDLERWRPSVIIIELSELGPLDAAKKRIRERILAAGYGLLFQDAINSLFTLAPSLRA